MTRENDTYVMGRSADETRRLEVQAKFYLEYTDHLLKAAGITPGMHVLDVGCGAGDATIQLARIVGPTGSVIGVDADSGVLAAAKQRVTELGIENVSFQQAILPDVVLNEQSDALVGRLILLHLPDPAGAVQAMATLVRPGGIISFQDFNTTRTRSVPALPLLTRSINLTVETLRAMGRAPDTGELLFSLFRAAGLPSPSIAVMTPASPHDTEAAATLLGETLISVLPFAEKTGVVTPGEVDPETLVHQLRAEARETPCVIYLPELVGAWARLPG
jgi:SAM-dependent methyltransferase